jgi:hypothetical protein
MAWGRSCGQTFSYVLSGVQYRIMALETSMNAGTQDGEFLLHGQTFDDGTIRIVWVLGGRQSVEKRNGGRVGEHVADSAEDGLDCVYPLELSQEVDVELGILGALSSEDRRSLRLRLSGKRSAI